MCAGTRWAHLVSTSVRRRDSFNSAQDFRWGRKMEAGTKRAAATEGVAAWTAEGGCPHICISPRASRAFSFPVYYAAAVSRSVVRRVDRDHNKAKHLATIEARSGKGLVTRGVDQC